MRAVALALLALTLPIATVRAADGPGPLGPASVVLKADSDELGPCAPGSGAAFDRIAACTDLVRIGRGGHAVYVARAAAYVDAGNRAAAVADLSAAIRLSPGDADAYAMRGALYLKDEAFRDGLIDLDTALVLAPGDENALRTRAFAWDELGNYPAAIADYTALLALSGDDAYRYFRGFAYLHHGESPAAVADFQAIMTSRVETLAAWGFRGRGMVREKDGDVAGALADYEAALAHDPADDRAYLGRCRMKAALAALADGSCAAHSITEAPP
jgi:tetratricopeptide (TPR) repeat protein